MSRTAVYFLWASVCLRTRVCLLWACGVLLAPCAWSQPIYYVATNGNNATGNGSAANPWATIEHAVNAIPDNGSQIVVRNGVYDGRVRINRRFQQTATIRAENPYRARLQEASQQVVTSFGGANFVLEGFEITRPSAQATGALVVQIQQGSDFAENITLRNNIFHDSYNNDLVKINNGCRNIVVEGNLFYNQQGSDEHIDINGVENVTVQDNVFFNDFAGSGRANANDTSGYIVIKNSAALPVYRGFTVRRNVFLNWEGSNGSNFVLIGEDGQPFHEAENVVVENNLMIGNSANTMRAPFGVKGGRNITFRNNTVSGNLPSNAFAMRLNREGSNPVNQDVRFYNNIWSDPAGTMGDFADGSPAETDGELIDNNVYWNNGQAIPSDADVLNMSNDPRALAGNPSLSAPSSVTLPRWTGSGFASGSASIRAEFVRLVNLYGAIGSNSVAINRSAPAQTPPDDILGRARGTQPDIGAFEFGGSTLSCDINGDSLVNIVDVQLSINQALGSTPCGGADLSQDGVCNIVDVQRVINTALGAACQTGT